MLKAKDKKKVIAKIRFDDIPFQEKVWQKASKEFKDCILGCLEKNPQKRFTITKLSKHNFFN